MNEKKSVERQVLIVKEVCEATGLSRNSVYEAIKRGDIPSIRIGHRILVPKAGLERMLRGTEADDGPVVVHCAVGIGNVHSALPIRHAEIQWAERADFTALDVPTIAHKRQLQKACRGVIRRQNPVSRLERTAYHEAAHVVVAGLHDFLVLDASIVPEGDSLGRVHLDPRSVPQRSRHDFVKRTANYVVFILAGHEAERRLDRHVFIDPRGPSNGDIMQVEKIVSELFPAVGPDVHERPQEALLRLRRDYVVLQRARSREWIRMHWVAIDMVAQALLRHKSLTTEQLREIVPHYVALPLGEARA